MNVARQERRRGLLPEAGQARDPVGGVADQRQEVGDALRPDAAPGPQGLLVDLAAPDPVHLHHPAAGEALAEVLVRREDAHLLDLVAEAGGGRGERVVGLELPHRPDHDPERAHRLLGGVELGEQLGRHALLGLVAGEEVVAERADGVVEGDGDVRDRLARVAEQRRQARRQPDDGLGLDSGQATGGRGASRSGPGRARRSRRRGAGA